MDIFSSLRWRLKTLLALTFRTVSLQTTIMAVEFDGGVVVGSDSRVSAG